MLNWWVLSKRSKVIIVCRFINIYCWCLSGRRLFLWIRSMLKFVTRWYLHFPLVLNSRVLLLLRKILVLLDIWEVSHPARHGRVWLKLPSFQGNIFSVILRVNWWIFMVLWEIVWILIWTIQSDWRGLKRSHRLNIFRKW